MPSRRVASQRHAKLFLARLQEIEAGFARGGPEAERSLTLFPTTWPQIEAAQAWAAHNVEIDEAAALLCSDFAGLAGPSTDSLLDMRRHLNERMEWLKSGLAAARRLKNRAGVAVHLHHLGLAHVELHAYDRGVECLVKARTIFRQLGERICEGTSYCAIGSALQSKGQPRRALTYFKKALSAYREAGSESHEVFVLDCIGSLYRSVGNAERAAQCFRDGLMLVRRLGNRVQEAGILKTLGSLYLGMGEDERAKDAFEQAAAITRETDDRAHRGYYSTESTGLGLSEVSAGDAKGIDKIQQDLSSFQAIGNKTGEGFTLIALGLAHWTLKMPQEAIKAYEKALRILREIAHPLGEATALQQLGLVWESLGDVRNAVKFYKESLAIFREIKYLRGEAQVLDYLSLAMEKLGQRQEATERAEAACKILEQIDHPNAQKVRDRLMKWRVG